MLSRRRFLESALAAAIAASLGAAEGKRAPRVVLRSSWQTVNIGDIAHTPGVLALLEKYFPEAEVTLWPSSVDNGVKAMLQARFPQLQFVGPAPDVTKLYAANDFLLHGSGPSLVGEKQVAMWRKQGPKPYGVLGITQGKPSAETAEILSGAQFVYFRDSVSLATAKAGGVNCPVMGFGPDGAFATDLRDEQKAEAFLHGWGLERDKFLCCIPRYRHTPYWRIHKERPFDPVKQKRNDEMKEHDHAQLRAAIVQVVMQTDLKILICPEDRTQMTLGKEVLFDPLPEEVKNRVVWRQDYWLTDEALSVYVRSAGLFGNEMHSPIMCIGNGIPAIVCRWAEQTSKGNMWKDIGLQEWLFDLDDESQLAGIIPAVLAMAKNPAAAKAKVVKAQSVLRERQSVAIGRVRSAASAAR
jgi:polysaccharide pyruvyl transferase WcaK-like protein